jgi:hypothetical protein
MGKKNHVETAASADPRSEASGTGKTLKQEDGPKLSKKMFPLHANQGVIQ